MTPAALTVKRGQILACYSISGVAISPQIERRICLKGKGPGLREYMSSII